jgi:flagellar hook-associated protein FlgK
MSIASTLNIAKEALLTHQSAISVAGHNIANVNTPGYSRQVLDLTTSVATPTGIGYFGNGVRGDTVTRQYDQFMLKRLMTQNATISNLTTQQQSLRMIETTFNEVPGLAVNELLGKYWESWQALSNNPELSSNRQTVVQQAELLNTQLHNMNAELTQTKFDTGVSLSAGIEEANALITQLADINTKLTASETPKQEQNDLRDTRDTLVNKLAGYVDINYFETSNGSYTVMMADGHTLVNNNEAWSLDWSDNTLQWVNINSNGNAVPVNLDSTTYLGGTIGGLLEINNQLTEGNPDNYLGRLDALTNALIREVNQQHSQGVGLVSFSSELTSAELANNATLLHTTVDSRSSADPLDAGSLEINGRTIGRIDGAKTTYGLAMGKTANAAQAINAAAAGVLARMTTQVAGSAATGMAVGDNGKSIDFTINGVQVSYTMDTTTMPDNDTDPAILAAKLVDTINAAIDNYNNNSGLTSPQANLPKITIKAMVGNGGNGGAQNSVILRNTNQGDESPIIISGVDSTGPAAYETKTGLVNGTYQADKDHNTGELSLFSNEGQIDITGGANDNNLAHLGWAGTTVYSNQAVTAETLERLPSAISFDLNGKTITVTIPDNSPPATVAQFTVNEINKWSTTTGVKAEVGDGTNGGVLNAIVFSSQTTNIAVTNLASGSAGADLLGFSAFTKTGVAAADETPGDGKLAYTAADHQVANSLMGLDYADTLKTNGGSFDLWLYNKDGSLALAQPVAIDLTRAYTLDDVANTINASIMNASNKTAPWVTASVVANRLVLKPDADHNFAVGNDTSNFLAAVGVNTFFSGHSVSTIGLNQAITGNLDNIAAGKINQFGEIFTGDNANALLLTNIQREENITYTGRGSRTDTLDGFYNSLIAEIGLRGKSIDSDLEYNQLLLDQLNEIRDASSGVSLDEEMANLIKFQHAYSAAAKLISTSDEMLKTLLDSVR